MITGIRPYARYQHGVVAERTYCGSGQEVLLPILARWKAAPSATPHRDLSAKASMGLVFERANPYSLARDNIGIREYEAGTPRGRGVVRWGLLAAHALGSLDLLDLGKDLA